MKNKEGEMMLEVIEPDYMAEFSCNGLLCPDTCCSGWEIVIDEATCERYEKSHNAEFKAALSRAIVHRKETTEDGEHDVACIRMGKGNRCLFLCNDGLCMIQRKTEEKNLSETCRTYPRVLYLWNEEFAERSLCVSCPAAARLILGRKEPLRFVTRKIQAAELDGLRIMEAGQRLESDCLPLRRFLLEVLQERKLPLTRRLQLANEFFWQAGAISGHHAAQKFHRLLVRYQQKLSEACGVPDAAVVARKTIIARKLEAVQRLFCHRLQNPELRLGFRRRLDGALAHWQLKAEAVISKQSLAQYAEDEELYRIVFLPEYGEILENYLVNGVFKNIFITEDGAPFYQNWFQLLVQFSIAKALLMAAMAENPKGFVREKIMETIQQTSRVIGHDALYLQQVANQLAAKQPEEEALHDFCDKMLA